MTRSLRLRLLIYVIGGMAVLQVGFSAVIFEEMERSLREGFNEMLASSLQTLTGAIEMDQQGVRVHADEPDLAGFQRTSQPDYFEVWNEAGTVVARSQSLGTGDLPKPANAGLSTVFRRISLPDGRRGRAAAIRFMPRVEDEAVGLVQPARLTLMVARGTATLDSEVSFLTWLLSIGTVGTVLASLLLAALIVQHGLRPLRHVAASIAAIRQEDLSARIPSDRLPTELAPVVLRLNDLLERLEGAFTRERAFTADVAHELRTPLAGLRSTIEVALARSRECAEYRDALSECQDIVRHAQDLADRLLALARMEGRQRAFTVETVRLAPMIEAACRPLVESSRARNLTLEMSVPRALVCRADRSLLATALSELAANAAEYTDVGGHVAVGAIASGAAVQVWFSNTGCRLRPEDVTHVFDRLWRGDVSRTQTGLHCGLGLTLVQRAVQAMNGSAEAAVDGHIFTLRIALPIATNEAVS